MKNNYAYIDGQNLHFGIKSLGWKLDHKKFREYLEKEHDVTKAYIFLGFMEEHQDLYNVLQEAGFICFFKPLVRYEDGTIKGNVDADMVLQVMIDIDKCDGAVIISGDGDFAGMLRHLSYKGKLSRVIIPNRDKYSSLFDRLEGFDENHVTYMNDLRAKLSYNLGKRPFNKPSARKQHPQKPQQPASKQSNNGSTSPAKHNSKPASHGPKPTSAKKYSKPAKRAETNGFKPKSQLEKSLIDTINNTD